MFSLYEPLVHGEKEKVLTNSTCSAPHSFLFSCPHSLLFSSRHETTLAQISWTKEKRPQNLMDQSKTTRNSTAHPHTFLRKIDHPQSEKSHPHPPEPTIFHETQNASTLRPSQRVGVNGRLLHRDLTSDVRSSHPSSFSRWALLRGEVWFFRKGTKGRSVLKRSLPL